MGPCRKLALGLERIGRPMRSRFRERRSDPYGSPFRSNGKGEVGKRSFAGGDVEIQIQDLVELSDVLLQPRSEGRSLVGPRLTYVKLPDLAESIHASTLSLV